MFWLLTEWLWDNGMQCLIVSGHMRKNSSSGEGEVWMIQVTDPQFWSVLIKQKYKQEHIRGMLLMSTAAAVWLICNEHIYIPSLGLILVCIQLFSTSLFSLKGNLCPQARQEPQQTKNHVSERVWLFWYLQEKFGKEWFSPISKSEGKTLGKGKTNLTYATMLHKTHGQNNVKKHMIKEWQ